jgi:hypothetical protein
MPWCESCSKFWNPATMRPDGSCPSCGRTIADPPEAVPTDASATGASIPTSSAAGGRVTIDADNIDIKALAGEDGKAPWHFKLLVGAVALYLAWRVVQLVMFVF